MIKSRHGSWIVLTAVAALALAVPQQKLFTWESKKGDFAIRQISSQLIEGAPQEGFKVEFKGNPLAGFSKSQSIDFNANQLNASIKSASNGSMYFESGRLAGQVRMWLDKGEKNESLLTSATLQFTENQNRSGATITLPSPFILISQEDGSESTRLTANSGTLVMSGPAERDREISSVDLSGGVNARTLGKRTNQKGSLSDFVTVLTSSTVQMRETENGTTVRFPGSFHVEDKETGPAGQVFSMRGSSGSLTLPSVFSQEPATGRPIKSANIAGRVTLILETVQDSKTKPGSKERAVIRASGDKLTMDSSGRIELTGNVDMETESMNGSSDYAYILVDDNMKVLKYGAGGRPATADYKPKTGGGR